MTRVSKTEVKRQATRLRATTRELELAVLRSTSMRREQDELELALTLAARAFEEARALEYLVRALVRKQRRAAEARAVRS